MKPVRSSRVRDSTSGPAGLTFDAATSASTAFARNAFSISASSASRSRSSMSARSSAIVSNSLAERASSSSTSGSTFSLISLTVTSTEDVDSSASSYVTLLVSPADAPTQRFLDLVDERARTELDHRVALRLPARRGDVDDERVAFPRGTPLGGHELGDGVAQRLELLLDELLRHLRVRLARPRAPSSRRRRPSAAPAPSR